MHFRSLSARAPRCFAPLLLLVSLCAARADDGEQALPPAYGWLEWAALEPGHVLMRAKLDTGARTSSLSAVDIERFERDGFDWVRFVVPISADDGITGAAQRIPMELPLQREALIKRHGARASRRPVVHVELCLGGHKFTTPVTLTDRSRFNYPLLLGRSALRGRAVIDVDQTYQHGLSPDECARFRPRPPDEQASTKE
ncbi:MAG: ATP-dependent zinc protease [Gammaproteobacteria bacterium]